MSSYRTVLRHGKVAVFKDQVIGVSYHDNSEQLAKFGMNIVEAGGQVNIHLASGGDILIDSKNPAEDAATWISMAELDM